MATLRDVLVSLERLDVRPHEIVISQQLYNFIIQQAREIASEEGESGLSEQIDTYFPE